MSLAITAVAAAVVVSAGVSYANSQKQAAAQKAALSQAKSNADRQALQAEQDMNRANRKMPDTAGILAAASQAGKSGASGTMLTGPSGVDPSTVSLGKSTLLGQ